MPTAVSLFSGCGGSDLGLAWAGFDVLMANDNLGYAGTVHQANFPDVDFHSESITEIDDFPDADLLAGCYPCQGFSQGGARNPNANINFLYQEFDRALRQIRPKAFVVENVSGMTRADNVQLLNNQIIRYRMAGYRVTWKVLNALDYGVAQERKRIFIVGIRSDFNLQYEFPEPTHGEGRAHQHLTQQDVIHNMAEWPEGEYCDQDFHWYYLSRNRYRAWDEPSKTIVSNLRHMPLHPISPPLVKVGNDKWIFEDKRPARRLSYKEAALLQGFPSDFVFPEEGSLAQKYKVVGNAVPPPLFEAVVSTIPQHIWEEND